MLNGCTKVRKLEISNWPFGNATLLEGMCKYESMKSIWMSAYPVHLWACSYLATDMPRLNVKIIKRKMRTISYGSSSPLADCVYICPSLAEPKRDSPPSVITFLKLLEV